MKQFLSSCVILCLVLSLTACKQKKETPKQINYPSSITLGSYFQAVDYAPFLIAKKKGWFDEALKDEGIKVNYETFEDLAVINDAFLKDKVDVIFEAEPPAIVSESAKVGIDIMDISCSLTQEILVGKETDIQTVKDLKGKKIAVLSGTSSHYGVLKLLKEQGINESDVEIIDMAPLDAKIAFETSKVDAWAVWPPFVEQQEISGKGRVLPKGDVFIHSIMAVDEDFMKNHPTIYAQIDKVFDTTKDWIVKNPEESITIVAEALNMDRAIVEKAWDKHNWSAKLNQVISDDIQNKADFLSNQKKIKAPLNVSDKLISKELLSQ